MVQDEGQSRYGDVKPVAAVRLGVWKETQKWVSRGH